MHINIKIKKNHVDNSYYTKCVTMFIVLKSIKSNSAILCNIKGITKTFKRINDSHKQSISRPNLLCHQCEICWFKVNLQHIKSHRSHILYQSSNI